MSREGERWVSYEEDGKSGWKCLETGEVRWQEDKPDLRAEAQARTREKVAKLKQDAQKAKDWPAHTLMVDPALDPGYPSGWYRFGNGPWHYSPALATPEQGSTPLQAEPFLGEGVPHAGAPGPTLCGNGLRHFEEGPPQHAEHEGSPAIVAGLSYGNGPYYFVGKRLHLEDETGTTCLSESGAFQSNPDAQLHPAWREWGDRLRANLLSSHRVGEARRLDLTLHPFLSEEMLTRVRLSGELEGTFPLSPFWFIPFYLTGRIPSEKPAGFRLLSNQIEQHGETFRFVALWEENPPCPAPTP